MADKRDYYEVLGLSKGASEADIKATLDFLNWVATSEKGTTALADEMGFVSPFKNAKQTKNVLCNIMNSYVAEGKYNVSWAFNLTPNPENWRNELVSALSAYTTGKGNFDAVKTAFIDGWAKEYNAAHS
jgi:raffinose/stachyose/melibiose transport system substrate-binding protein